jgi:lysophospholipase L1-like esterase
VQAGVKQMKKFWKSDPVHMTEQGYEELAKMLVEQMVETELSRKLEKKETPVVDKKMVD